MYPSVIYEYINWVDRGHLPSAPVTCRKCGLYMLAYAEEDSIALTCGLCSYKRYIGLYEYNKLEALVQLAVQQFSGE